MHCCEAFALLHLSCAFREDPWFTPSGEGHASQGGASDPAAAGNGASGASLDGNAAAEEQQRLSELAGHAADSGGADGSAGGGSWDANAVAAGGRVSAL